MREEQNWWQRNWKWVVPTGCGGCLLLVVLVAGGIGLAVFGVLKSTDVYTDAVDMAKQDSRVVAALGEPIEAGFLVSGSVSVNGSQGEADISIPLSGPEGSGKLYVVAGREAGEWEYTRLELEVEGQAERIDLLD